MSFDLMRGGDPDLLQAAHLIPTDQAVVFVDAETTVRHALEAMEGHGFDQIPVRSGDFVVGVFSYHALAQWILHHARKNEDVLESPVGDLVGETAFIRAASDLSDVMEQLKGSGFAMVGDEGSVRAVLTAGDALHYLWQVAHPFVLLQDIELAIRKLMSDCLTDTGLGACLDRAIQGERREKVIRLSDLTMGETITVLTNPANYGTTFQKAFGKNRQIALGTLEPIRDIRNKVFHFRDEVTASEMDEIVSARRYLRLRIRLSSKQQREDS